MTKVRIERGGRRVTVEITGHSNYKGVPGTDIVCASASMLAGTLAQHVQKLYSGHVIEELYVFEYKTERVFIDFLISEKPACVVMGTTLMDVIKTGFEMLAEQYPKNVKLVS